MKLNDTSLTPAIDTAEEQQIYARLIELWTRAGALLLLAAFAANVSGLLPPNVALEQLPQYWGHTVQHFLSLSGSTAGWTGLAHESAGDIGDLFGIALLSSGPPLCLLALVPAHAKRRDWMQVTFCIGIAALMIAAAAGLPHPNS